MRSANPNLFINLTTGTNASPSWLLYADSIWRQGDDINLYGPGTPVQQWMTYRDAETYRSIVRKGPLFPLNSLMYHGIVSAEKRLLRAGESANGQRFCRSGLELLRHRHPATGAVYHPVNAEQGEVGYPGAGGEMVAG
jgi:hypothetical protein